MATMLKYLVKEKSLVGNTIYEAGQEAEYDGLPADNLEPTCDEGRARAEEYRASNAERVKNMIAANSESAVGNADAFMAAVRKEMAESQAAMATAISAGVAQAVQAIMAAMGNQAAPAAIAAEPEEKAAADAAETAAQPKVSRTAKPAADPDKAEG